MAKTTIVQVSDDLDGSANSSEVRFAFEGIDYAIDLSSKNRKALEKALRPYVEAGTKVSGRRSVQPALRDPSVPATPGTPR